MKLSNANATQQLKCVLYNNIKLAGANSIETFLSDLNGNN
jgi:hypothetical protein